MKKIYIGQQKARTVSHTLVSQGADNARSIPLHKAKERSRLHAGASPYFPVVLNLVDFWDRKFLSSVARRNAIYFLIFNNLGSTCLIWQ